MSPSLKQLYRMVLGKYSLPDSKIKIKNFSYDDEGNFKYDAVLEFSYTPVVPLEFIKMDLSLETK